ncbi:hypothetical protein [Streptomyces sp. NPDC008125]
MTWRRDGDAVRLRCAAVRAGVRPLRHLGMRGPAPAEASDDVAPVSS